MSDHAFLAPSSAHIWGPGGCAAHPMMAARYPDSEESTHAREGTAAHEYLSTALTDGVLMNVGDLAANGHPITQEMVDGAQDLIADVLSWREACGGQFAVEQKLVMPEIHPTLNWGTTDIIGVDHARKIFRIRDFKYGYRYVDPWENWQVVDYGVGGARFFGITLTPEWTVEMGVFQPRSYHPDGPKKIWPVSGAKFQELADDLAYAARKASEPDPEFKPGKYCQDCSARFHCPALWGVGGVVTDFAAKGLPDHQLTAEQAASALRYLKMAIDRLEALTTGVEAELMAALRAGKSVPHWAIGHTDARERWTAPYADVVAMGSLFGKDLSKPPEPITPAQARKLGIDAAVISEYSMKPTGAAKLVPSDDKQAAKVFK